MLAAISRFFMGGSRSEAIKKKEFLDAQKLDELLEQLTRVEDVTHTDFRTQQPVDLNYNCLQKEGVITALHETGGIINGKHKFTKVTAGNDFTQLRIGQRLTFFMFESKVSCMKVDSNSCWDDEEEEVKIPNNEDIKGFGTDVRSVQGVVSEINNEIISVNIGTDRPICSLLEDLTDLKWKFEKFDLVVLDCIINDDESTWNASSGTFGEILSVKSLKPSRKTREIGCVTSVLADGAVIDHSTWISKTISTVPLVIDEEYEYEAIETQAMVEGRMMSWRATKVIKKIASDADRKTTHNGIRLFDAPFSLRHDMNTKAERSISIFNNSKCPITMLSCEMSSNSGYVQLEKVELNVEILPGQRYNIYLVIMPRVVGTLSEEIVADFGDFQKKSIVTVEVYDENHTKSARSSKKEFDGKELIPGQKIRQSPRFIDVRIKDYSIPEEFSLVDHKKSALLLIYDMKESPYKFLFEELTKENYVSKMRHCLYLEEIATRIAFDRYKIERGHFENRGEFLRLEMNGLHEKRPSITLGDSVRVTDPFPGNQNKIEYEGCIHKVEKNALLLKFNPSFHTTHRNKDFRVEFYFSRTGIKRQHFAIDKMVSMGYLGYDFIFPKIVTTNVSSQVDVSITEDGLLQFRGRQLPFFNPNLNEYQKEAVKNVLRADNRPLPYIIYGPPGTGKTSTVTECIEQIWDKIPKSRILVGAPSNSAADLILERLLASGRLKGGDIIRLVSFNQIEKDRIPKHLRKFCATVDIGYDDGKSHNMKTTDDGVRLQVGKSLILNYRIFVSTLSTIATLMHYHFERDHFTHVIVDEAGQTIETEIMIPISSVTRRGQVILAGDPKQLGPIIISQVAKEAGFEKSFLERLSEHIYYSPSYGPNENEFDPRFVTKLKRNYRSIPAILDIYNNLHYNGELKAEVNDVDSKEVKLLQSIDSILWNREKADPKCGLFFVNVSEGRNMRNNDSCSWFNIVEAAKLYMFLRKLMQNGVESKDIGVITPYTLQVRELKRIINDSWPENNIKVGTVEEFQGQERMVILVSTVRTNQNDTQTDVQYNLGFLKCHKRMNVAISRARALLVVFGKESILARDDDWRYLINETKKKGTYVSV